ncbi:MAG TPA: methyltransferase domain-containing protein [Chloroflexota bacterium]|nr:methyltransferase domain-containing protein [Chloroflexota bacterium]
MHIIASISQFRQAGIRFSERGAIPAIRSLRASVILGRAGCVCPHATTRYTEACPGCPFAYTIGTTALHQELECWSRRQLHTRFRGPYGKETLEFLCTIRDKVLDRAGLQPGEWVLDVGSGDGLLAFGALHRVFPGGLVILDDISQDHLDVCTEVAREAGVEERLRFVRNDATDLRDVPDHSVDAVITRSVLLYVEDKAKAAAEFRRVLRSGGRVSLFEPISSAATADHRFGIDPGPVALLAARVEEAFRALQSPQTQAMLNFDERDLLRVFEAAGFTHLELELRASVKREQQSLAWFDALLNGPTNPRIPTMRQAISAALTPDEAAAYLAHYRRAVAGGPITTRQAMAYLWGSVAE